MTGQLIMHFTGQEDHWSKKMLPWEQNSVFLDADDYYKNG